jgi:hypothetical protein
VCYILKKTGKSRKKGKKGVGVEIINHPERYIAVDGVWERVGLIISRCGFEHLFDKQLMSLNSVSICKMVIRMRELY